MPAVVKYMVALAVLLGVSAVMPLASAAEKKDCTKIEDPAERAKCEQDNESGG